MGRIGRVGIGLALLAGAATAWADDHARTLVVASAWSRELPPVSGNGAAYVTVRNTSGTGDRLVGVETPVAARAEIHEHVHAGGMTRMRRVVSLVVPAHGTLEMGPGGVHIMLMELERPLRRGESFPVTLHFASAPPLAVRVQVRALDGREAMPRSGRQDTKMPHDGAAHRDTTMQHDPGMPPGHGNTPR